MPTHYGPWITPAPLVTTAFLGAGSTPGAVGGQAAPDFVAACEFPPFDVSRGTSVPPDAGWLQNVPGYTIEQFQWCFTFDLSTGIFYPDYVPVLPALAVGVEYDATGSADFLDRVLSVHVDLTISDTTPAGTTPLDCSFRLITEHPAELTYPTGRFPAFHWLPGATVAGRTTLGTASLPAASSTTTLSADLPLTDIDTAHTTRAMQVVLVYDQQVAHTSPAALSGRRVVVVNPSMVATYQPHNYRFVYSTAPRLRQLPRDDALGGAPRQAEASRSVQASARQGWVGTYR